MLSISRCWRVVRLLLLCGSLGAWPARGGEAAATPDNPKQLDIGEDWDLARLKEELDRRADWETIACAADIDDAWMGEFLRCPELRALAIHSPRGNPYLTPEGLARLADAKKLTSLSVRPLVNPFTDAALAALARGLPELESLEILHQRSGAITADGLSVLAAAKKLRTLRLDPASVDKRLAAALAQCPDLTELSIHAETAPLDNETALALAELPNLTRLTARVADDVGDEAVLALARRRPDLQGLILFSGAPISGAAFAEVAKLRRLKELWLIPAPEVGDQTIAALVEGCPELESLRLANEKAAVFTDASLASLAKAPHLKNFTLSGAGGVTDAGLEALAEAKNLEWFSLNGAKEITDAGILFLAGIPGLKNARLFDSPLVSEAGLAKLKELKPGLRLNILSLARYGDARYGDAGTFDGQRADAKTLLLPQGCDDAKFKELLAGRTDWEKVWSSSSATKDEWLAEIARLPELTEVRIQAWGGNDNLAGLTDEGVRALAARPKLKTLRIQQMGAPLSDETLAALARGCPDLEELSLRFGWMRLHGFSADGLPALGGFKKLRILEIDAADVDGRLPAALADNCPDLERLVIPGNDTHPFAAADLLPLAKLEKLVAIQTHAAADIDDELLMALAKDRPNLELLVLETDVAAPGLVTDEGLAALASCANLRALSLNVAPEAGDKGILALVGNKPPLNQLNLDGLGELTDDGLAALGGLRRLANLRLGGAAKITDAGLIGFCDRRARGEGFLWGLELPAAANLTDKGLEALAKLPRLNTLNLAAATDITDAGVLALAKLENLQQISLTSAAKVTDRGLLSLARQGVYYVDLSAATELTPEGVAEFKKMNPRQYIQLQTPLTPTSHVYSYFGAAVDAKTLNLPVNCDDALFRKLLASRDDWEVFWSSAHETKDEWLAEIARRPQIREVRVRAWGSGDTLNQLTDEGVRALAGLPRLRILEIVPMRSAVYDETLAALARGCPELEELSMQFWGQSNGFSADGLLVLGEFKKLKKLELPLDDSPVDGRLLATLAENCPELASLSIRNNRPPGFAARDILPLAGLKNLVDLQLQFTRPDVGDEVVMALAKDRPNLEALAFGYGGAQGRVSDAGLAALAPCANLRMLRLGMAPDAGDAGVLAFAENKPRLMIFDAGGLGGLTDEGLAAFADKPVLHSLHIGGAADITDDGLVRLAAKSPRNLYEVSLPAAARVTDKGLAALARLPRLTSLILSAADKITDGGVETLARRRDLGRLDLAAATRITDKGLAALGKQRNLYWLDLSAAAGVTPAGEAAFKDLKPNVSLSTPLSPRAYGNNNLAAARAAGAKPALTLVVPAGTDADGFRALMAGRADWEAIRSESKELDDSWMEEIAECKNLLSFSNTYSSPLNLTSAGMGLLGKCPKLKTLQLCSENPLLDEDFAAIARGCPDLVDIHVCDGGDLGFLTDEGLVALGNCHQLKKLRLRAVAPGGVTDHLPQTFANENPSLESIVIGDVGDRNLIPTDITDAGLAALGYCENLRIVEMGVSPRAGDAGLAGLARAGKLLNIALPGAAAFTDKALEPLAGMPALVTLRLPSAAALTDAGTAALAGLGNLAYVDLSGCAGLGDATLGHLAKSANLWNINLSAATGVTDAGLAALKDLRRLRQFRAGGAAITDAGVEALAKNNPTLSHLRLSLAEKLTDASLDSLARLDNPTNVSLNESAGFTWEGVDRLKRRKPRLSLNTPAPAGRPDGDEPRMEVF